jgi:Phosphoribosylanthranilate isomerase
LSDVKIKICGLRRAEDIEAVNAAMPDFIGFVFAKSPRQIDSKTAAELKRKLDSCISAVGVFVNQPIDFIAELYRDGIIEIAQLHGDEDDEYINRLRQVCDCKIIKSVSVGDELPVLPKTADYLLFDKASTQRGGTGEAFDWSALKNYQGISYFLAGGLTPENVSDALNRLSPSGVDVSSGVETNSFKDSDKINKFVQTVRRKQ